SHATATPQIYTLSLHDALPISGNEKLYELVTTPRASGFRFQHFDGSIRNAITGSAAGNARTRRASDGNGRTVRQWQGSPALQDRDRKSTRLNSSHLVISYAVFC